MRVACRRSRFIALMAGLVMAVGAGACDVDTDRPGGSGAEPGGALREGPAAAWTLTVSTGEHQVAVVGAVAVVTDERALLGVDLVSGAQRWRREIPGSYSIVIAGGLVVQVNKNGPLEVVDPATGAVRWRDDRTGGRYVVRQDTVYADDCADRSASGQSGCTIEAREVSDGRTRWKLSTARFGVRDDRIGSRAPEAPMSGPYVLAGTASRADGRAWGAVDARTGRALKGRLPALGWYGFALGDVLVTTDHDPPSGDRRCTVTVTAVDAQTGARRWAGAVYSGRRTDGECQKTLVDRGSGAVLIGSGSRVVAVTAQGRPQLVDLADGRTVWTAAAQGAPIDGDDRSLLVREYADQGSLTVLDAVSGKTRWWAPDPGLDGGSASWASAVTDRLVAVTGAADERPFVLVHDVETGRQLGRFPSWLVGAGEDWVAVTHGGAPAGKLTLEFIRL